MLWATTTDDVENGGQFAPRFSSEGLVACVTVDAGDGAVLMVAHMNAEALEKTLATGIVHYWSRSRGRLWRKGDTSGQIQTAGGDARRLRPGRVARVRPRRRRRRRLPYRTALVLLPSRSRPTAGTSLVRKCRKN